MPLGFAQRAAARRPRGAGGATATPLPQLGSLVARWSADDISVQADNSALASWTDSVSGFVASQPVAGSRPVYRTAQIGAKPGVQFSGAQVLDAGRPAAIMNAMDATRIYTMVVVASRITGGGTKVVAGTSSASGLLFMGNGARAGIFPSADYPYTSAAPIVLGHVNYSGAAALGSGSIKSLQYANGGAFTGADTFDSGGGNLALGGFASGAFAAECVVHDWLIWNGSLTPADMIQVQKWHCDKHGLPYPWAASVKFDIFHGDSLTHGQSKDAAEFSYPSYVASMNARPLGSWTNLGFSGTTWDMMDTVTGSFVDAIPAVLGTGVQARLACFEWANQQSTDGVQTRTAANAYRAHRKAANLALKIVFGTSTDTTAAGAQTVGRNAYNAYYDVIGNRANVDAYVPIHINTNIGVDGAANSTTYFNADKVHMTGRANYPTTGSGYGELASLIAPVLAAL